MAEEETEHREMRQINANDGMPASSTHLTHGLPVSPAVERIVSSKDHTVADENLARPPAPFRGREFTVFRINDSATSHSEKHYLVHWADSIVPKHLTGAVNSGFVVTVDGEEWEAVSCIDVGPGEDCEEHCYIEWKDTWVPEWQLDNARDAIAEFESQENANAVLGSEEDIRSSIERSPLDQEEPSSPPTARRDRHQSPEIDLAHENQPNIPRLIFKPEAAADYRPGLRELVQRVIGTDSSVFRKWPEQNDKRHLLFSDSYITKGLGFDMTRSERLNAAFAQTSGAKQRPPCECCEKGNGAFIGCVVAANFAAGACANCAAGRNPRKCNFHQKSKPKPSFHRLKLIISSYRGSLGAYDGIIGLTVAISRRSAKTRPGRLSHSTTHSTLPPSCRRLSRARRFSAHASYNSAGRVFQPWSIDQ